MVCGVGPCLIAIPASGASILGNDLVPATVAKARELLSSLREVKAQEMIGDGIREHVAAAAFKALAVHGEVPSIKQHFPFWPTY
jgi:hypothetical protein